LGRAVLRRAGAHRPALWRSAVDVDQRHWYSPSYRWAGHLLRALDAIVDARNAALRAPSASRPPLL